MPLPIEADEVVKPGEPVPQSDMLAWMQGAETVVTDAEAAVASSAADAGAAADAATAAQVSALSAAASAATSADASGDAAIYDDKAAAVAALGGLSEGDIVEVLVDESYGDLRVRYRVESAALVRKIVLPEGAIRFPTLAAAIAGAATLPTGAVVDVLGGSTPGDGGGFFGVVEAADHADNPGGGPIRPINAPRDSAQLQLLIDAVDDAGGKTIRLEGDLTLDAPVNFKGMVVDGGGHALEGAGYDMRDVGGWKNVTQNGHRIDKPLSPPPPLEPGGLKIIYAGEGVYDGRVYVVSQGTAGPLCQREYFTGNIVAPSEPSDSVNANWDRWRPGTVQRTVAAWAYKKPDTFTGTWSDWNPTSNQLGYASGGIFKDWDGYRSQVAGNTAAWTDLVVPEDGELRLAFYSSATSPPDLIIRQDGVSLGSFDIQGADGLWVLRVNVRPGTSTIQIEHPTGSANVYALGANVTRADCLCHGLDVDGVCVLTGSPGYVLSRGEHGYAIKNAADDLWAGGFHGGETAVSSPEFRLDGVAIDPTVSGYVGVGRVFGVYQHTRLDWPSGETMDVRSHIAVSDSAEALTVTMEGSVRATTAHFGMSGTSDSLNRVIFPVHLDTTGLSATQTLRPSNMVVQLNNASGQRVVSQFTDLGAANLPDYAGGPTVTPAPSASYDKVYGPYTRNSDQTYANVAFVFTRHFV